jgi:hypothetical protein
MRAREFTPYWFLKASALIVAASVGGWIVGGATVAGGPKFFSSEILSENFSLACNIKGNISLNSGERIYHVPGQEFYNVTRISEQHGERWFCSEAEARQAGWRRSRR